MLSRILLTVILTLAVFELNRIGISPLNVWTSNIACRMFSPVGSWLLANIMVYCGKQHQRPVVPLTTWNVIGS